jgi:hypothetical protein
MDTVLKTLLAFALGLGFLILDAHSKPSVAFLGLSQESNPMVRENLASRIQYDIAADTGLFVFPKEDVAMLFAKGILNEPEISPLDLPRLSKGMGAQYYACGKLEGLSLACKRIWWKPWAVKVKWSQGVRMRVLEAASGQVVSDSLVSGDLADKAFLLEPTPWEKMTPLEQDGFLRRMLPVISLSSAKALAKVVKEKAAPVGAAAAK